MLTRIFTVCEKTGEWTKFLSQDFGHSTAYKGTNKKEFALRIEDIAGIDIDARDPWNIRGALRLTIPFIRDGDFWLGEFEDQRQLTATEMDPKGPLFQQLNASGLFYIEGRYPQFMLINRNSVGRDNLQEASELFRLLEQGYPADTDMLRELWKELPGFWAMQAPTGYLAYTP